MFMAVGQRFLMLLRDSFVSFCFVPVYLLLVCLVLFRLDLARSDPIRSKSARFGSTGKTLVFVNLRFPVLLHCCATSPNVAWP